MVNSPCTTWSEFVGHAETEDPRRHDLGDVPVVRSRHVGLDPRRIGVEGVQRISVDLHVFRPELEDLRQPEIDERAQRTLLRTERLEAQRGWSMATVKTMLGRLAAKGVVSHREDGRRFLYSPAIEREAYVGSESRRFVERLFGGRLSPLVARLAEEDGLDAKDIAEIEALLRELKS